MKNLLLLSFLLISSFFAPAQQLNNSGLDSWTNAIIYYYPNNWGHTNILVTLGNPVMVKRSTDRRSGSYAAQLDTKILTNNPSPDTLPDTLPGTLFTGMANLNTQIFGIPYTYRIAKLSFWYKYTPVGSDTGGCYVGLFKRNTTLNQRDTIADGYIAIAGTNTNWMLGEVFLNYRMADIPDTLGVMFASSIPGKAIPNSSIKIDDISVSLLTGVEMDFPVNNRIEIYPQPMVDKITIRSLSFDLEGVKMEIRDVNSCILKTAVLEADVSEISIRDFTSGIYFATFSTKEGRVLYSSKLIKL